MMIRRILTIRDVVHEEAGLPAARPVCRVVAAAVIANPLASQASEDVETLIPSNAKIVAAGETIDVPLGHKDDPWSFDHIDTMTVQVPGAPRPDEIVVVLAFADGGRPRPRVGAPVAAPTAAPPR
jgi:hypothetical protein